MPGEGAAMKSKTHCAWAPLQLSVALALVVTLGSAGCTSRCVDAGVTVDGNGNIVVRGEDGLISPNSAILKNVASWPGPPGGEQNFAFSQGYALSRDGGSLYLLANTAEHPNLVYRIDLNSGRSAPIGSHGGEDSASAPTDARTAATSKETWITADGEYVYSVDQAQPAVSRGTLSQDAKLAPFIVGSRTKLRGPIGVAVDRDGKLCALDGETASILCYAPSARGNVAPVQTIDTKATLGYQQVDDLTFGRAGQLVVMGTSDLHGLKGFSLAVFDVAGSAPRLLRTIGGPETTLTFPGSIGVDRAGNILVLQGNAEIVAFGPEQRGNVAPSSTREPAASTSHPFRMAVDRRTGDVAILGADGVAYFPKAANGAPSTWPAEVRLPLRGWDVAFGNGSLVVADDFGTPIAHALGQALKEPTIARSPILNLHDPEFISRDQRGRLYVASNDGVITALPADPSKTLETTTISFRTPFDRNMSAFAADSGGYYYLTSSSNNAIIVIGPNGRQSTISGRNTGLNHPVGLAVAQDGTLFVANADGNDVLEFSRGSTGDVSPTAKIAGSATALIAPQALAIDSTGRLYVFDGPSTAGGSGAGHYVRVYDSTARGDVAPLKVYPVQTKCWVNAL
jgi:sugar lactone lactonase YvrE